MNAPTQQDSRSQRTRALVRRLLAATAAAFLFGFTLVPLYNIACEKVFGIKLEARPAAQPAAFKPDPERLVTVQFDATVHSGLDWEFTPKQASMQVRPGVPAEAWYSVRNRASRALVGHAVPSVAPNVASIFFNKTECFCFTEQALAALEQRDMPVRFVIDPQLPRNIRVLTLGYVFYLNGEATARLAGATRSPAAP